MFISINLNQEAAEMTASILGCQLVEPEQADWFLVFYLTSSGGTTDPMTIIKPEQTTVIAGPYSSVAYTFAGAARERGVLPEHILFLPPGPLDRDKFRTAIRSTMAARKPKVIGFVSEKGGTGKTTLATALAYHYLHFNLDAMLLDTCPVPNAHYHLAEQVFQGNILALNEYKKQRIIVDSPTGFNPPHEDAFDVTVAVVDADVVQCIRPTRKAWPHIDIAVYNRGRNAVPSELVEQIMGCPIISIADDFQGCSAALAAQQTANTKSETMEKAIGQLARFIEGGYTEGGVSNNVENVCSWIG